MTIQLAVAAAILLVGAALVIGRAELARQSVDSATTAAASAERLVRDTEAINQHVARVDADPSLARPTRYGDDLPLRERAELALFTARLDANAISYGVDPYWNDKIATIGSLKPGQNGYTLPWAFSLNYPVYSRDAGNATMPVGRSADGELWIGDNAAQAGQGEE